ncbi:hypothetical protein TNCT_402091 [Trichonephila clavata]|uniref:Uncharacterized protein n=1 Tax=Trichonephila clavata TaxID=2740835 RepID=A0A8X6EXH2_TRICU|nr:hypothetical protein TNCT_402091 [Trichonephila clavata]
MPFDASVKLSDSLALNPSSFGLILSGSRSHTMVSFNFTVRNINMVTSTQELDNGHTHIRLHHLGVHIVLSGLLSTFGSLRGRHGRQIEEPLPSETFVPSAHLLPQELILLDL